MRTKTNSTDRAEARRRREESADRYRPASVSLLLVAEAPPASLDRYFYFEDVPQHDSLFRYVSKLILGEAPSGNRKGQQLRQLQDQGVFLIDVSPNPLDGTSLDAYIPSLIERCQQLKPQAIILIKATVYDAAFTKLSEVGLPVVDERIPFPGSGRQSEFEESFASALALAERLLLN